MLKRLNATVVMATNSGKLPHNYQSCRYEDLLDEARSFGFLFLVNGDYAKPEASSASKDVCSVERAHFK